MENLIVNKLQRISTHDSLWYVYLLLSRIYRSLPVIILGFLGKRSYVYNGISTVIMIVIIFSSDTYNLFGQKYLSVQLISFVIYLIWQVLLIMWYYKSRQK